MKLDCSSTKRAIAKWNWRGRESWEFNLAFMWNEIMSENNESRAFWIHTAIRSWKVWVNPKPQSRIKKYCSWTELSFDREHNRLLQYCFASDCRRKQMDVVLFYVTLVFSFVQSFRKSRITKWKESIKISMVAYGTAGRKFGFDRRPPIEIADAMTISW